MTRPEFLHTEGLICAESGSGQGSYDILLSRVTILPGFWDDSPNMPSLKTGMFVSQCVGKCFGCKVT